MRYRGSWQRVAQAAGSAALLMAVIVGVAACSGPQQPQPTGGSTAAPVPGSASPEQTTPPVTATSTPPADAPPAGGGVTATATPSPTVAGVGTTAPQPAVLRPGDRGPQVLALQQRLSELGYWLGTPDGTYGDLTTQAVTALQKVAGLGRDGIAGPKTQAALDRAAGPSARSTSGRVAEIDLQHQVMLLVDGGTVSRVLNVSTGSGEYYTAPDGHVGHAVTPPGRYTIFRSVDGWDTSPLGHLYRPRYFNGGIAVHGYPSVPAYPASHGCVRVSLPAMDLLWSSGALARGMSVWVY